MPRKRQQPNGLPPVMPQGAMAQAPAAATGQDYGAAGAQLDAQAAMPLSAPVDPMAAAMEQAQGMDMGGITPLFAETEYPDEPLTAGLPSGPGPGPEALGMQERPRPVANLLQQIATATGDPALRQLADEAQKRRV